MNLVLWVCSILDAFNGLVLFTSFSIRFHFESLYVCFVYSVDARGGEAFFRVVEIKTGVKWKQNES